MQRSIAAVHSITWVYREFGSLVRLLHPLLTSIVRNWAISVFKRNPNYSTFGSEIESIAFFWSRVIIVFRESQDFGIDKRGGSQCRRMKVWHPPRLLLCFLKALNVAPAEGTNDIVEPCARPIRDRSKEHGAAFSVKLVLECLPRTERRRSQRSVRVPAKSDVFLSSAPCHHWLGTLRGRLWINRGWNRNSLIGFRQSIGYVGVAASKPGGGLASNSDWRQGDGSTPVG
jgi:hypothetical protein